MPLTTIYGAILWEEELPLFINGGAYSYDLPMHTHDFVEIAYISEGRGIHYVGGDQIFVEPGDLFVIAIGTPHVFRPLSIEQLFHLDPYIYRYYKNQQNEVGPLVEKLYMEYTLRLPEYQLLLNTQMIYLISILYRYEAQGISQLTTRNRLEPVFQYINIHFNEIMKIETLAALIPISVPFSKTV
jgi:AraC family L-rhamnose operon transcriptional activator RhaR